MEMEAPFDGLLLIVVTSIKRHQAPDTLNVIWLCCTINTYDEEKYSPK